jgi:hypothetical protein
MSDCRKKPRIFPKVHLIPTATEEHAQGMQAIYNPYVEQKGHGGRTRKPSGSMRICGCIPRGVTRVNA